MSTSNHPILEFPLITSPLEMMEKTIKWKPNNIELAPNCPRCASSNTKFCYYNNYSVSQPRYFCKACRRYWTKGGSLRNVPIGGGCRKSRRSHSERQDCAVSSLEYSSKNGSENGGDIQIDDIPAVFAKCANKNVEKYYESTDSALFEGEDGKYVMSDDQLDHHHSLNGDQDFVFQSFDGFEVEGILGSEIWSEETNLQSFGSEKLQEFEVFSSDDQIRMSENLVTDINWGSFDLSTYENF